MSMSAYHHPLQVITTLKRKKNDYVKGSSSPIPFVTNVATADWQSFVSDNQEQKLKFDTNECSQLSPAKSSMEGQLNFMLANNMFSEGALSFFNGNGYIVNGKFYIAHQFNAILDGTSIDGNNPVNTAISYQNDGIIPRSMLNMTLEQSQMYGSQEDQDRAFYDRVNITPAMVALGKESLKHIRTLYQWINDETGASTSLSTLSACLKQAPLVYGIAIPQVVALWNQQFVKWDGGKALDHCVGGVYVDLNSNNPYPICVEDNYAPFRKQLSSDYFINQVLQIVVTAGPQHILGDSTVSLSVVQQLIGILKKIKNGIFA